MDLFIVKTYSHRYNHRENFISGHSSEDLATDAVKAILSPDYRVESSRIVTPLPAETKPFVEEV